MSYGLVVSGLTLAVLLLLRPPLPRREQQCRGDVFATGIISWPHLPALAPAHRCSPRRCFTAVQLPTSWRALPAPLGTGSSIRTETRVSCFLLAPKPPKEAFQSKQTPHSVSAGKFCFVCLWKRPWGSWLAAAEEEAAACAGGQQRLPYVSTGDAAPQMLCPALGPPL